MRVAACLHPDGGTGTSHTNGARQSVWERMHPGMQCVRQDLQTVHQPRTRAAEIVRAVRHVHLVGAYAGMSFHPGTDCNDGRSHNVRSTPKPAAGDEHNLGLPGQHFIPSKGPRRLPLLAESLDATRQSDQLGAPMAQAARIAANRMKLPPLHDPAEPEETGVGLQATSGTHHFTPSGR